MSPQPISSWRAESRAVIARALREGAAQGLEGLKLQAHVRKQYPFGERAHWPYKIWLEEVRRACGRKLADRPTMEAAVEGHPFLRMPAKGGGG